MKNPSNIEFKIIAVFKFENLKEAVKVRNLLKKYKYEISSIDKQSTCDHREKRLMFIVNNLSGRPEPIDMGKFFSNCYATSFNASYRTFARDIGVLVLQGKVKATSVYNGKKGNTTLIEKSKESDKENIC